MRTILVHEFVTGGGMAGQDLPRTWATEGAAMRRALASDLATLERTRVVMTLDSRFRDEPGPWTVVRVGPGEELAELEHLAPEADYTALIAPETGGLHFERAQFLERLGARLLGSSAKAVFLCSKKLGLRQVFESCGIAYPETRLCWPRQGLPREFPYPAVFKPIEGAGSVDTFAVGSPEHCPDALFDLEVGILQPFLVGEPRSASFLVASDRHIETIAVGRQRIDIHDGRFSYLGGTLPDGPPELAAEARRAIEAIEGLRGWVGVDFVWNPAEGIATILEVNPRLTTSYLGARRLLDRGELARAWLTALEEPTRLPALGLAEKLRGASPVTFEADGTILQQESSS